MRRHFVTAVAALGLLAGCMAVNSFAADPADKTVWGNPVKGVSLSVTPVSNQFRIGEKMEIHVAIKNLGISEVNMITEVKDYNNYKIVMFDSQGTPVPFAKEYEEYKPWVSDASPYELPAFKVKQVDKNLKVIEEPAEPTTSTDPKDSESKPKIPKPGAQRKLARIAPGLTADDPGILFLSEWFNIDRPGTYTVVVMRKILNWDAGFPISNAIKIEVTR